MKKVISFICILSILTCLLYGCNKQTIDPTKVFTTDNGANFIEITGLTDYGKTLSEITIPSEINGKKVISISEHAFYDCDNLVSVNINARYIKESAFENCDNLENITLCDNGKYKTIWQNAFADTAFFYNEQNWDNGLLYIGKVLYKAKELSTLNLYRSKKFLSILALVSI